MRRPIILVIALVFAVALLARAVTYTVRFTEAGVLTTFGKAVETDPEAARKPGLKFKWPDPIQSVTKYDVRERFLQTKAEQIQTSDSRQITVEAFCTWRVADPLKFFQRFSNAGSRADDHFRKAEEILRANLRSALGEVSKYPMGGLFTSTPGASQLGKLEEAVLAALRTASQQGANVSDYGVEVTSVGINRIELPEETTKAVFDSMKRERDRLIKRLESEGESVYTSITTSATANSTKILSFANAYAKEIESEGVKEAQQYTAQMNQNPELAVFLKNIEFMKEVVATRITMVFSPSNAGMGIVSPPTTSRDGKISSNKGLMGSDLGDTARGTPQTQAPEPVMPAGGHP